MPAFCLPFFLLEDSRCKNWTERLSNDLIKCFEFSPQISLPRHHPLYWLEIIKSSVDADLFYHNLEFHLFPYLRPCVRLMMMSRMKTCSLSLHAPSDGFSPQEVRVLIFTGRFPGCVCFFTPGNYKLHLFIYELILLYEQASSHTSWLKAIL
jgi:hypothetical protein